MSLRKEDIVFIISPHRWKDHRYSLGVLYVSGYLRDHGFDNVLIERGMFDYPKHDKEIARRLIIEKVKELKPKMVGFTSTVQEFDEVIEINQELKKSLDFLSVIGGPQSTAKPEEFLENGFDVAVVGEGEKTMLELVMAVDKIQDCRVESEPVNRSLVRFGMANNIKGIVYKDDQGGIVRNGTREYMDIADLSLPAYDKIDMERYVGMWDGVIRGLPLRGAIMMTSRGCPYACTFCDCNKVFGQKVRYRSLENIRREVQLLKEKYNVEGIWLADDTFTLNREHILGVGKIMKEFKLIWGAQARVNLIDEGLIKQMKADGCIQFDLGVESGNQRVLDEVMNKRTNLAQVREAFRLCRKHRIRTLANLMMGLPTERLSEMQETFKLAREIKANFYVFSIFTPLPGTTLFDRYYSQEINFKDYKELSFFAGVERFNKSEVKDLKPLNTKWRKALAWEMKKRNWAVPFLMLKLFYRLGYKKERLGFVLNKIKKLIRLIK